MLFGMLKPPTPPSDKFWRDINAFALGFHNELFS